MKNLWKRPYLLLIMFLLIILPGCVKDPVTGRASFNLMTEGQEVALGAASHDSVLDAYGLYEDQEWQAYIDKIGQDLAKVSHRPHLEYHFHVVDSPVVNAFALPGGWIYFTRGILAHFNSEDELAGVMGHEIGHVTARHGAEQYSRTQIAGIGLEVASAYSEKFRQYRGLAELGTGLLFLKFSRGQESESDKLGVQYAATVGYDTHQMAGFFKTIARISGDSGQSLPNFLSTHPNPLNREKRVHELTDEFRAQNEFRPRNTDREAYLRRLEGLVWGEDPRQGFLDEAKNMVFHPQWDIQFPVPNGWKMARNRNTFQFVNSEQNAAIILLKDTKATSSEEAASQFEQETNARILDRDPVRRNGYSGIRLKSELVTQDGNLTVLSYFLNNGKGYFQGHGFTKSDQYPGLERLFSQSFQGFGRLTDRAAKRKKPDRIRIKRASRDGSLESHLRAFGVNSPEDLQTHAILNGMELADSVPKGTLLKTTGQ